MLRFLLGLLVGVAATRMALRARPTTSMAAAGGRVDELSSAARSPAGAMMDAGDGTGGRASFGGPAAPAAASRAPY